MLEMRNIITVKRTTQVAGEFGPVGGETSSIEYKCRIKPVSTKTRVALHDTIYAKADYKIEFPLPVSLDRTATTEKVELFWHDNGDKELQVVTPGSDPIGMGRATIVYVTERKP